MKFQRFTLSTLFKGNPETATHSNHRANRVRLELCLTLAFLILAGWLAMPEHFMKRKVWAHFTAEASQTTSIACGQTISSSISAAGEQDTYTFTANAGEAINISAVATQGDLCARVELYDPMNQLIAANPGSSCNSIIGAKLTKTGVYTVLVRDRDLRNIGAYDLSLQFVTGRCASPISCGQTRSATTTSITQLDIYTFSANAGEAVNLSAVATSGSLCARVELFNPSGDLITANPGNSCNSIIGAKLTVTGVYTVQVRDRDLRNIGSYDLSLQFVTGRCATPISCGQTRSATTTSTTQMDTYTFSANAGEAVNLSAVATSGSLCARVELYNQSGDLIAANPGSSCNSIIGAKLIAAGNYTVLVRDRDLRNIGAYDLSLQFVTGRCATSISCGQTRSATTASITQMDTYTFSANAGEAVNLSAVATSGNLCARVELYNSSGDLIAANPGSSCNSIIGAKLTAAGSYTVLVRDRDLRNIGAYDLTLQFVTGRCATPISCGETKSATTTSITQLNTYTFSADAGEAVNLSAVATSGSLCARVELYNQSGDLIAANPGSSCNSIIGAKLTAAGNYTVLVRDRDLRNIGAYDLSLQFVSGRCATPISCGQTRNATTTSITQLDTYTFCGVEGSSVIISAIATSGSLCARVELYDPSVDPISANPGSSCNSSISVTLTASGNYTILVRDRDLKNTGEYNVRLTCIGPTCPPPPLSITLAPPSQTILVGENGSLTAIISPPQSTATTVMLTSSNPGVAEVDLPVIIIPPNTSSAMFSVTGVRAGTAKISATLPNGISAMADVTVNNPVPTLSSLSPSSATAGGPAFTLTVNGANFVDDSKVRWNGDDRVTNFVSDTQLTAMITAADIAMQGTALVTVFNPAPGGGVSPPLSFTITPARIVKVMDASGNAGATVTVPIKLISLGDENALGFSLTFDTAVLSNPQATLCGDAAGAMLTPNPSQIGQGRLGIAIALPPGQVFPTGERCIVNVTFTIAANAQAGMTEIGFGDQPIGREVVGVNANPLSGTDYVPGKVTIVTGYECDVAPRPNGDGRCTIADWVQCGRFAAGLDTPANGSEFQRADCAPKETRGDGRLSIADWVQCGRCAAGLDSLVPAGGPTSPASALALAARIGLTAADARDEVANARLLHLAETAIEYGVSRSIAVSLDTRGDENAAGFSLSFDARQWRFVSAVVGRDAANAALQVNDSQAKRGRVGFALALPAGDTWAMGARQLVVVTFAAVAEGQFDTSIIRLADLPIAPEVVDASAKPLSVHYRDETDAPVKTVRGNLE